MVVANIVGFVQEVGHEFLHGFPIFGFNFMTEIDKHVWRDGEMFRRHGVVAMEVVKFWRILEIAFHYYAVSLWVGIFIMSKPAISSGERKRKFPTGNGWLIAPPYKLLDFGNAGSPISTREVGLADLSMD